MHILIVTDQHPDSLGGAQVAIRAQRASLERMGHRVTVAAPRLHRPGYRVETERRDAYIDLPSLPITRDREYGISLPTRRTMRVLAERLRGLPPVDVVHLQGDFWGALIGVRAARGMRKPLVITMHNNVDRGTRAVTPLAPLAFVGLRAWRAVTLGRPRGEVSKRARGAWRYLAQLAAEADAVIAPSSHFADTLRAHVVAAEVHVVRGGVDDELVARVRHVPRGSRDRPLLVWLGRLSHEKRVFEFVDALERARLDADVRIIGGGLLARQVQQRVNEAGLADRVTLVGAVSHEQALAELHGADALVQTSIGFETQGLTPFEAAVLGTPTVCCDPVVADDLAVMPQWLASGSSVEALAEALRTAVSDLAAKPGAVRVARSDARGFTQDAQSERLVALYARVTRGGAGRAGG